MFGIGFSEMIVIGVILIIAVGPSRMPGMLKALVRGYREFRKATRELRASTGIDEILQDEDLRSIRKPLHVPPARKAPPAARRRSLSYAERAQENPSEGVDLAEIRATEKRPSAEEAEKIRQAKEAAAAREQEIISAKIAAAEREDDPIRAAKIAAADRDDDPVRATEHAGDESEDAERIRASKIAAAAEEEERRAAKIAAAERDEDAMHAAHRRASGRE